MEPSFPQFLHHGAADGVTGSCHRYMASPHIHLLVDCGLFQGSEASKGQAIDFDLSCVAALVVTHVHIDHIGRIPYLFAAGFKGPILCSAPSARLLPLVIEDALKMGFTRDKKLIKQFLQKVQASLLPLAYNKWYPLVTKPCLQLKVRLQRAGHILGSSYVEIDLKQRAAESARWVSHRTVFSGDVGAPYAPLLPAPRSPYKADTLVIESTYGNRVHEDRRERRLRLKALVEKALKDQGTVMIPAFSIGRTQELLYELEGIIHEVGIKPVGASLAGDSVGASGKSPARQAPTIADSVDWSELPIIVDSPLAAKFTEVYRDLKPYWDEEALQRVKSGRHPLSFENVLTIDSHDDHMRVVRYLAETKKPAIVIAASGMAAGGRIVNYLKAMLGNARHNVLFVGFQVPGTPGFEILKTSSSRSLPAGDRFEKKCSPAGRLLQSVGSIKFIELDGEQIPVRAGVESVGGYSAHADQQNLLTFVRGMRNWPGQIRVVHGNDEARKTLGEHFRAMFGKAGKELEVVLPKRAPGEGRGSG